MSLYDDFLKGKPLNDDLRVLMEGAPAEVADAAVSDKKSVAGVEVSAGQQGALRQLIGSTGWDALMDLLEGRICQLRDEAVRLSETDPLGNKDMGVKMWMTVKAWKEVKAELGLLILEATTEPRTLEEWGDDSGME